ncbi:MULTISPECIES: pyridoxine 5'-phosphate synthase [Thermodesulfovibrio]|uniref:Pyridoxine 5'-phosphate synthase n=2 Tax=Thermodesulfovibrio yellowstonii TaxID=28262 RepID=PDXJ_THEYD|nr:MULTISPECIES: pyridoxine 5'-phosphate synthase [Thermodesulfovibrio]B5YGR4.1 RecName: Full=Pyridoxine 5'-phosphate synthase; Short=PNP synthase [Thermodesulfovibrio yellowstonii DSM 11347]ACI21730.1 pyridoxal phosphate biosynthetic protein PdxJ [Thermodesulfovibrio yellowstonii DSM 11347]GLI52982.1 pyridoxine 5'-phosphate synthase [Thermodesulfovibrio islandicus]
MVILGVNVDHIATVRQARKTFEPDPVMAATLAILGGADGITIHLREDRRHIQDRDLKILREVVPCELNLEMAATEEMINIALNIKPDMVTIVPEKRQELTTEGGLNVIELKDSLKEAIKKIKDAGIPVSLFINPERNDIECSKDIGADMVEIHTGYYSESRGDVQLKELERIKDAVAYSISLGLKTNAGHGLNYYNVKSIAAIKGLRGLYIGHSIIARAVLVGIEKAVREMKNLIKEACINA